MSSSPPKDLWLERSRFNGMLLDGISYGIMSVLTIQCIYALVNKPSCARGSRAVLLLYLIVTFALATIGLAGNAKYSQMIWIDLRDSPEGPEGLIVNELGFWENRMALTSNYIMSWLMDALLLHRCFVIWNWHTLVVVSMSILLLANISMAISTLVASSKGALFTQINFQLAAFTLSVSTNFIYTILVASRLLAWRRKTKDALGEEYSKVYTSVAALVVESAALYTGFGIIYVVMYALHNTAENLVFLWIIHVQAIAQMLIILRVAKGQAFTQNVTAARSALVFASASVQHQHSARDLSSLSSLPVSTRKVSELVPDADTGGGRGPLV